MRFPPSEKIRSANSASFFGSPLFVRLAGIALFLFVVLTFSRAIAGEFVNYDDNEYVTENPHVTGGLTWANVQWAFAHSHAANWHPLTWMSHMLDCNLFGLDPRGPHAINILFHALTAVLLFALLNQLAFFPLRNLFIALVFAVHPLRVESVAWIAERKDVLSGFFFMLTLIAYVVYARGPSIAKYALAVALLALGLLAKPMLVTVPLILLLLDFWPLRRLEFGPSWPILAKNWPLILEKLPFALLAIGSCAATLLAQQAAIQPLGHIPIFHRLENALLTTIVYLLQWVWPANLIVIYPLYPALLAPWKIGACLLVSLLISVGAFYRRARQPYLLMGWLWYLIMLIPVIGIIKVGDQAHADRYTYLPLIGLSIAFTWGCADWANRLKLPPKALFAFAAAIIIAAALATRVQIQYWQNSEALWNRALSFTSQSFIAYNNRGLVAMEQGKPQAALRDFEHSLEINPRYQEGRQNYWQALVLAGRVDEAIAQLQDATHRNPNYAWAESLLADAYAAKGATRSALEHYDAALKIAPDTMAALNNLAWILSTHGDASLRDGKRAVFLAEKANALANEKNPAILGTVAAAYAETGNYAEASRLAQRAIALTKGAPAKNSLQRQLDTYRTSAPWRE